MLHGDMNLISEIIYLEIELLSMEFYDGYFDENYNVLIYDGWIIKNFKHYFDDDYKELWTASSANYSMELVKMQSINFKTSALTLIVRLIYKQNHGKRMSNLQPERISTGIRNPTG